MAHKKTTLLSMDLKRGKTPISNQLLSWDTMSTWKQNPPIYFIQKQWLEHIFKYKSVSNIRIKSYIFLLNCYLIQCEMKLYWHCYSIRFSFSSIFIHNWSKSKLNTSINKTLDKKTKKQWNYRIFTNEHPIVSVVKRKYY